MKNLVTRTVTGIFYLVVFIGALLLGKYTFGILFLVFALLALWEFYQMVKLMGYNPQTIFGLFTGGMIFILTFICSSFNLPISYIAGLIPFFIGMFIFELYRNKKNPASNIAFTLMGLFYIIVPMSVFNYFAFFDGQSYSYRIILGFFILLWMNDIFAYIFGISFGRHRLFESISPKKSWEGFIGGAIMSLISSFFIFKIFNVLSITDWIIIGVIISIAGVYGDLAESLIKRTVNIKDSGKILPGHGGMLDRIDSVLLSSPLVFMYLILFR